MAWFYSAVDTLETKDEVVREAIAFAPIALSGVTDEIKSSVVDSMMTARHGEQIKRMDEFEVALETANSAFELAAADLRREAGLSEGEFSKLTATAGAVEQKDAA